MIRSTLATSSAWNVNTDFHTCVWLIDKTARSREQYRQTKQRLRRARYGKNSYAWHIKEWFFVNPVLYFIYLASPQCCRHNSLYSVLLDANTHPYALRRWDDRHGILLPWLSCVTTQTVCVVATQRQITSAKHCFWCTKETQGKVNKILKSAK